ncbi:MAG: Bro-N domain-containing protein [Proteobacteria bacterium]|nr:Bro-N domain-containing protein [Pseudomonadota bacterium]
MSELLPFAFEDSLVRVRADADGEPWFVAKDVCNVLGLENPRTSTALLDDDEKGVHTMDTLGGPQEMSTVSESGLYSLVFRSRKPEAKRFRKWVTAEVLPSLRKTGSYAAGPASASMEQLRELVAVWAMLTEMPRAALLSQVLLRFGLAGEEEPAGAVLAAVRFVLEQNDVLLCKGRRVSQKSVRLYEAFTNGELFEPELVSAFWKQFDLLNTEPGPDGDAPGWLNHSRSPGLLAVNLPQFLRASQTFGLFAFNGAELRRLLRRSYPRKLAAVNKTMRSPHAGKPVKCWVFYLNTSPISDDWGDSPTARGTRPETEPNGEGRA